jgi:SNF2 family DNA or RNA helicase
VLIGQLQAAGTAINLTAANQVLFAESSWVPAENLQAAKRCHRMGQHRPVFVRISALDDSIDELIADTIQRKLENHIEIGEPYAIAN